MTQPIEETLDEYLFNNSHITPYYTLTVKQDVRTLTDTEKIRIYIHPQNEDGDTIDFIVDGNSLIPDPDCQRITQ